MAKILVVDDDEMLASSIQDWLQAEKHEVELVNNGTDGLQYMRDLPYEVVILDWNMPGLEGIEVCRRYRSNGGNAAILMLTGMNQTRDKLTGLDAGADDYLTKPFEIEELASRVKALLRRSRQFVGNTLVAGDLELDIVTRRVVRSGVEITLKPIEFALLEYLMKHPNEVISPEALLKQVWPSDVDASLDAVYTCVTRVRKKINDEGRHGLIRNVHGVGYQFCPTKS